MYHAVNLVRVTSCLQCNARAVRQGWPSKGTLTLEGIKMRYRPGLDLVLKEVNLDVKVPNPRELLLFPRGQRLRKAG